MSTSDVIVQKHKVISFPFDKTHILHKTFREISFPKLPL